MPTPKPILCLALLLLCGASRGLAFTGMGDGGDEAGLALTTATAAHEVVLALQLTPAAGLGLAGGADALLGQFGLSAERVLGVLAPHLSACTAKLAKSEGSGRAVHEYYDLYFGAYPLAQGSLHLHHYDNRLAMVRAALPDFRLPAAPFTAEDFLPLATLGFEAPDGQEQTARAVVAESGGFPAPAWELTRFDPRLGRSRRLVVDAQTGAVLSREALGFDLAEVYEKSPADAVLISVALPDLPGTGYLDGKHFVVYAPTAADPRVQAPDNRFDFRPADPADALAFDQVQAYYGATRALAWFQRRFGYDIGAAQVVVSVDALVNGSAANAAYLPAPAGPRILIGKGDATLTNLARDTAVVSHEFAHHIIYQHLTGRSGESGVLHEGTADYFAYAINGDPCLGESIVPGGRCLRTALLPAGARYDQQPPGADIHVLGQYWSAVLWELRAQLGETADRVVYDALAYLGAGSGLSDAFLALLNADRDRFPLPAGTDGAGAFGQHRCLILQTAVARGFAQAMTGLDGAACGLNLGDLAQQSRDIALQVSMGDKGDNRKGASISLFGRKCAVIAAPADGAGGGGAAALALLALPLAAALARARRSRRER